MVVSLGTLPGHAGRTFVTDPQTKPSTTGREKSLNVRSNLLTVCLQREMSGVNQMSLGVGQIPFVRNGAFCGEDGVVLSPDNERWRLVLAEERLEVGIERQVGAVVVQHVQLDFWIAGTVKSNLI